MNVRIPWLISRKKLILNCLIDIGLIYILNNFFFYNYLKFAENILTFSIFIVPFWMIYSYIIGRYSYYEFISLDNIINSFFIFFIKTFVVIILSIGSIFIISFNINLNNYNHFDKIIFYYAIILSTCINLVEFPLIYFFIKNSRREEKWLFIGSKSIFKSLEEEVKWGRMKIKIQYLNIENDFSFKNISNIDGVFSDKFYEMTDNQLQELSALNNKGVKIINILDWCENYLQRFPPEYISKEYLILGNFNKSLTSIELRLKRVGDLVLSFWLLIFSCPVILIACLLIYFEDRKSILYSQYRVGLNQKIFKIYKLRTMKFNAEKNGPQWSKKNDKRVTKIGRILRNFRIDELPQLICVIRGDMSLIGPRPERSLIDDKLNNSIPYYGIRYSVKPGLSGWAQVNYPYGASLSDSKKKLSYDLYYLRNFSFWLDLLIFFKTIRLVILKRGSIPFK